MKNENFVKIFGIVLIISIIVLTFWFSSKSGDSTMEQSNMVLLKMKLVSQYDVEVRTSRYTRLTVFIRKGAHFAIFMVLGVGIALATEGKQKKGIILIILLALFDELHQMSVGRGARFSDMLIDVVGGMSGWIAVRQIKIFKHMR